VITNATAAAIFVGVQIAMKKPIVKEQQLPLPLIRELPATPGNLIYFGDAAKAILRKRYRVTRLWLA
jgi:hypothetical protein